MTDTAEVEALLNQIDATPFGPEERTLVREADAKAAELANDDLLYRVRLRATTSAHMSGDTEQALTSFTWCVSKHDSDQARFPAAVDGQSLLWQFKWVASMLLTNPAFSLERVDEIVADMERRYREAGVGLSGVWQARFINALLTGRVADASQHRRQRDLIPRDDYSHCDACVRSDDIGYFLELGSADEALRLFDQIIDGGFSCGDEPERAQGLVLLPLLRAGRVADAVQHHQQGLRLAERNADPLPLVALHLPFLAVTGNAPKALTLIETHLPRWGEDTLHALSQLEIAIAVAVALDAVAEAGYPDVLVANSDGERLAAMLGVPTQQWRVADLANAMWRYAQDQSAAFDRRNGTTRYAQRLERAKAIRDETFDVRLYGEQPFQAATQVAAEVTSPELVFEQATLLRNLCNQPSVAFEKLQSSLAATDGELRVEYLLVGWQLALELGLAAAASWHEQLIAELRQRGRVAEAEIYSSVGPTTSATEAELTQWLDVPDEVARSIALASAIAQAQDPDDYAAAYAAMQQLTHPQAKRRVSNARMNHLLVLLNNDQTEEATALAAELRALDVPSITYLTNLNLGRLSGAKGEFTKGIEYVLGAQEVALQFAMPELIAQASQLLAQLYLDAGDLPRALRQLRIALRQAELGKLDSHGPILFQLGVLLSEAGDFADAADAFEACHRVDTAAGEGPASLGYDLYHLGMAAQHFDLNRAYHALMGAVEAGEAGEDAELSCRSRLQLGRLLVRVEDEDSVDALEVAAAQARQLEEPPLLADALHALGRAKSIFGQSGIEELLEARAVAEPFATPWERADLADSIGRAQLGDGQLAEGVAALLRAADAYAAAGDLAGAAGSEVAAGRALAGANQGEDAVVAYTSAIERLQQVNAEAVAIVSAELADVYDDLGEANRAAELRAQLSAAADDDEAE